MLRCRFSIFTKRFSSFIEKPIETVPSAIHSHLFDGTPTPSTSSTSSATLQLPKLRNSNLLEHFRVITQEQIDPYSDLLEEAINLERFDAKFPNEWKYEVGWTRYGHDGSVQKVHYPEEDVFTFDVETCVIEGQLPTIAVALSKEAWYGWCSEFLVKDVPYPRFSTLKELIPLGGHNRTRIAIGHNVGYDRARSQEPYLKERTKLRFMDTMSMSIPMFGLADHQRNKYGAFDNDIWEVESDTKKRKPEGPHYQWQRRTSKNSLADVYKHLCDDSTPVDKSVRSVFVKEDITVIRAQFQELFNYCATDALLTARIFAKLWPMFKERFPEQATLAGLLTMGDAYLPINKNWYRFYERNQEELDNKQTTSAQTVVKTATRLLNQSGEKVMPLSGYDNWLCHVDWNQSAKSQLPAWFVKLFKKKKDAEKPIDELTSGDIVIKSAYIPYIFGILYGPYPVYKSKSFGWGYLVPDKDKTAKDLPLWCSSDKFNDMIETNKLDYGDWELPDKEKEIVYGCYKFYQIPHPDGQGNVGDFLTKNFFAAIEQKVIRPTRFVDEFEIILDSLKTTRFWNNYRDRYDSEVPIWYDGEESSPDSGAIAPAIVPAGTVSRRSVHKLWVTLTNQSEGNQIGTGVKSMIQAPPGYRLVGADVDSQEQWLAGLYGDASAAKALPVSDRHPGLTPFSNMMLAGSKSDGTDLHTVVAKQLGISRGQAKTLNYARLYGSGERHAAKSLMQSGMKKEKAEQVANNLFTITKGASLRWMCLRKEMNSIFYDFLKIKPDTIHTTVDGFYYVPHYTNSFRDHTLKFEEWLLSLLGNSKIDSQKLIPLLYQNNGSVSKLYFGGYESATFNFLEQQSAKDHLRTPVLGCQLTDSLASLPEGVEGREAHKAEYKRSVMNWLVQSSAVDFLHLMIVCMDWLCKDFDIDARFVISIHDEEEEAPRLALALMLSNMYVRAFVSQKVGIHQLPTTVAFFSQVDNDLVLRKEVDSVIHNPDGYRIPDGVAWDLQNIIALTNGSLEKKTEA